MGQCARWFVRRVPILFSTRFLHMRRNLRVFVVVCSVATLCWAGCGDDADTNTTTGGQTSSSSSTAVSTGAVTGSTATSGAGGSSTDKSQCNPITNEGCDASGGEACDASNANVFGCFDPPNERALCEECGEGPGWCKATYTCVESGDNKGYCAKYCCDDNDCSAGGKCVPRFTDFDVTTVGVCMRAGAGGAGMGGAGGAGVGGAGGAGGAGVGGAGGAGTGGAGGGTPPTGPVTQTHDCAAPVVAPSNGSCVVLP